ncbi:LPS export ABC transporter periplasmic protein LptC, partial [Vibrio cholerae]
MSLSRIVYVLLLFIASWSLYYLLGQEQDSKIQVAPNLELPMFSGENLENISYDEQGIRNYVITSIHLDH